MTPPRERVLLELDFGDTSLTVRAFSDGQYRVELGDTELLVNAPQMQTIVGGFIGVGKVEGWT